MMFAVIVIGIAIVSIILSYFSLQKEMKKGKHEEEVKKQLKKERVIFYASNHRKK